MSARMRASSSTRLLKLVFIVAIVNILSGCNEGGDSSQNVSDSTTQVSTASVVLHPASAEIRVSETTQFNAYVEGTDNAKVKWTYEGCGWIESSTGQYHAPTVISAGRTDCSATLVATSIEDPAIKAEAQVQVEVVEPSQQEVIPPVVKTTPKIEIKVTEPEVLEILDSVPVTKNEPVDNKPKSDPVINTILKETTVPTQIITSEEEQTSFNEGLPGKLVVYPGVSQYKSNRFSVKVSQNGTSKHSFVYQSDNNTRPNWSGTFDYMQDGNHWTTFSFDGSVQVEAKRLDGKSINTCVVRPLALKVKPVIQSNRCTFTLNKPVKVSVEIDENYKKKHTLKHSGTFTKHVVKNPLFVFADPLEKNIPNASDPMVLYFGPGIHRIGKKYKLKNNTQVYIAGGAYVIGTFISANSNPKNISIRGRGILSGIDLNESSKEYKAWGNHSIDFSKGNKGNKLSIEGITITDPIRSCIVSYNPVNISNVKLFSWNHRNDGITAGQKSVVQDSFIKVQDDNIKLYFGGQTIRRNVIWQQTSGSVFKFAWALARMSQGNKVSDIDIIHSDVFDDHDGAEKDRAEMQSTSAIFSAMGFKKKAGFRNSSFKNIRIEEEHLMRLLSLRMVSTHQNAKDSSKNSYWGDPHPNASKLIEGLTFENLTLAGIPYKQSTLYGNMGGKIRNIKFKRMKINGVVIDSKSLLSSKNDGAGLLTAGDVVGISFSE